MVPYKIIDIFGVTHYTKFLPNHSIRKKFGGGFNFMIFVDDEDPQNFLVKLTI